MEMFTWWDARGRRLPWLIALVLVLSGGYAVEEAVARPEPLMAHSAGVVPVARVFLKSTRDASDNCHAAEWYFRMAWRCEGWWGGTCQRRSLSQPNYVWCGRPVSPARPLGYYQYFFMSSADGRRHMDVWRSALYFAGPNGTSGIRLVRGTTKWKSRIIGGGGQG